MKLFLKSQMTKLVKNFHAQQESGELKLKPVVKLFTPNRNCTWLVTELDPDTNLMFALCDIGLGCIEMGWVSLDEITNTRGTWIERDRNFEADKTLIEYWREHKDAGYLQV